MKTYASTSNFAVSFIGGYEADAFAHDKRTFYATVRCLEIISEASRRLPDAVKAHHPSISWQQIASAGNIYRHEYGGLAPRRVLDTVRFALPLLRDIVDLELASAD